TTANPIAKSERLWSYLLSCTDRNIWDTVLDRSHMPSALDSLQRLPVPRQQLVEPVDRMSVDHALEHVVQISIGLDVIHLAWFDERANRRPSLSTSVPATR